MDMPIYASEDYAHFKVSINPRNRGFWDLRVHGDYYEGIKVTIYPAVVFFKQTRVGEKYTWLANKLEFWNNEPLGLSEDKWAEVQDGMKPKLRAKIEKVISGV